MCSGAAHLAEELIDQTGWAVTLGHPGMVNRMKRNPDKSDKADAWILADLIRLARVTQHRLPKVWLATERVNRTEARETGERDGGLGQPLLEEGKVSPVPRWGSRSLSKHPFGLRLPSIGRLGRTLA